MASVVAALPTSKDRLREYQDVQETNLICSSLSQYCTKYWPAKHKLSVAISPYWEYRASFMLANNLLLYASHIVVPASLQQGKSIKAIKEFSTADLEPRQQCGG